MKIGVLLSGNGVFDGSEIQEDEKNRIVPAPCYMMEASVSEIRNNVKMAVDRTIELI